MPTWFWWLALGVNVVTLLAYGWDKMLARLGRRRIPEGTLLWLTFLGCIGAWCGMSFFRHKTRKTGFRLRALGLTILNPLWVAMWWEMG